METVPAEALDLRYQALSDPKRRRILELLGDDERCVCELVDEMEVGQSLLSFHLKTLRDAELVDCRRDGRWVHYRIRHDALAELRTHLLKLAPDRGNAFEEG
jgi:ArsR family transcriptional regulator